MTFIEDFVLLPIRMTPNFNWMKANGFIFDRIGIVAQEKKRDDILSVADFR